MNESIGNAGGVSVLPRPFSGSEGMGFPSAAIGAGSRRTVLENGLRVVTEPVPAVRSISMAVLADAGPGLDPPGKEGLAHLVEHLMFQGTSTRDALAIARLMDDAGGQIGGFTSRDYTCYAATVLDDYRTYALELLGDILLNSTFPDAALERQQRAIVCEIEARRDSVEHRLETNLKQLAWSGTLLGRPIAGSPESVLRLKRADVLRFVADSYLPEHMIVAAAGRVDHDDFVSQVRDAFWRLGSDQGLPSAPPPATATTAAAGRCDPLPGRVSLEHRPLAQAYFSIALPAGPYADPERYPLFLLDRILGGGISSRLFRRLREEEGMVYDIGSQLHCYRRAGLWLIRGSTAPQNLSAALRKVLVELTGLLSGSRGADEEELVRARRQLSAQHLLGGENPHTRMSRLATQELYFGRSLSTEEIVVGIEAVNEDALLSRAQALRAAARGRLCLAVLAPDEPRWYGNESLEELLREMDLRF